MSLSVQPPGVHN